MQRSNTLFTFVIVLGAFFILTGCERAKIPLKKVYTVSYYENEFLYVGTSITIPVDPEKYDRKLASYTAFWNIDGQEKEVSIPSPSMHATFCARLNKIIAPTPLGLVIIPVDGEANPRLLEEDDMLFLAMRAESIGAEKILLLANKSGSLRLLLVGLNVITGKTTKFEIPGVEIPRAPSDMVFVDPNTAVVSVEKDLVWVRFSEDDSHNFSVEKGGGQKGAIKGVYNGEMVYYSEDESKGKALLQFGETTVQFDETVRYVFSSSSFLWAIARKGQVFRISSDGSKSLVETITLDKVVGIGSNAERLWIVTKEGNVTMYDGKGREEAKITLP